jgi:hypothetical protein
MMRILSTVAWPVCSGIIQIINTYCAIVITYFLPNQAIPALKMSPNLKTFLDQVKDQNSSLIVGVKNMYTNMKMDAKVRLEWK